MSEISILFSVALIIFLSPYVAKVIKIPISPTEILLGMVVGFFGFLPQNELFKSVSEIGFYYMMFLAGTEVDLKIFLNIKREILKKVLLFLAILYFLTILLVFGFGLEQIFAIVIPTMSIGLLSTLYKDYGKNEIWLNRAMLIGIIGEVISIGVITIGAIYLKNGFGSDLFLHIFALCAFLLMATFVFKGLETLFWWYPNLKTIIMPKYDKNEKDIRFAAAILFFVAGIMLMLDLEIVIGAFIAGTFIPTFFEHKKDLPQKLSGFGFGFLVPIFFIHTGSVVDLRSVLLPGVLPNIVIIVVSMFAFRLIASSVFLKEFKLKNTILTSLSLSMPLTLVIATATIGKTLEIINNEIYYALVLSSIFEAVLSMVLIKFVFNLKKS
ncbi:MAG: cation:proton antiporter [Campylobacter sp.]|nr:cation:proton antiporter [Campylobacter sp.]